MKSPLLLGASILMMFASCSPKPPAATSTKSMDDPSPLDLATGLAEEHPMPRYLRVTGELKSAEQALVAADAVGKVISAPIERGSVVKAGDVLIKLDDRNAQLSLQEAEASLKSAELALELRSSELKRNEPLAKTKAISDSDFQKFKIDFSSAEATLAASMARRDMARKTVADCAILAPFAGTVAERLVNLGEYVNVTTQVANLVATDKLRLTLNVPETAIGKIQLGQVVEFSVPAYSGERFTGTIKFIGSAVRSTARDLLVEAEVTNKDGKLKPGMFAEARVATGELPAIIVPRTAVRIEGSTKKLFVVVDGRLVERLVDLGETKGDLTEIRRGLNKGETIVLAPTKETSDGARVKVAAAQ